MDKEEAVKEIKELSGDEHTWVDFKQDYHVSGNDAVKAEFIKDIQSLANAQTPRSERYLFIGCSEEDGIVGVDGAAYDKDRDIRHILSYDADDLQDIVDGSLEPSPVIELYRYEHNQSNFAALIIRNHKSSPPVVSTSSYYMDGDPMLRSGDIIVRKSSGKKKAEREDIERLIRQRLDERREYVLEGIKRMVALDPDTVTKIGKLEPSDAASADISFEISPDGDYTVEAKEFNREFGSIDRELEFEIGKRRENSGYYIRLSDLKRYYSDVTPPKDIEAVSLLAESAMDNYLPGIYWCVNMPTDEIAEVVESLPDNHSMRQTACKTLLILGEQEQFETYVDQNFDKENPGFDVRGYRSAFSGDIMTRLDKTLSTQSTEIEVRDKTIDCTELRGQEKILDDITDIASAWRDQSSKDKKYKYAVRNLELVLLSSIVEERES